MISLAQVTKLLLFYLFLLSFRYFIVLLPHHQNDKRYAANYKKS